ncbi:MAG: AraC family transcriptional regulator [Nevskia sp.]|nr:AraC family transcriptional regulator [Nevskia sp.]
MHFDEVRRNLVSVQLLTRLGTEHGMTPAACLRDTGLDQAALSHPETEITGSQELQVVRNLAAGLAHLPGIGLDAGLRYHLAAYGIWGFALVSSPTYRSAAEVAVRYLDLSYAFVSFRIEVHGKDFVIVLDDAGIPADVRQFLVERDFAAWVNAAREMLPGGLRVRGLQFRFPRPDYAERFATLCGVEPRFGAPRNAIVLDLVDVEAPMPQGNALTSRALQEQCHRLLDRRRARSGIAGQVRDRLLHSVNRFPTIGTVASALNLGPRSLRRRLEEEGTSYRVLTDEVRRILAEELLTSGRLKLEEVSERLGYAEPASFTHAFKRWTGVSPANYRKAHLEKGSS